ncbi:hypothetical protein UlMin_012693 [Ulmus minor]
MKFYTRRGKRSPKLENFRKDEVHNQTCGLSGVPNTPRLFQKVYRRRKKGEPIFLDLNVSVWGSEEETGFSGESIDVGKSSDISENNGNSDGGIDDCGKLFPEIPCTQFVLVPDLNTKLEEKLDDFVPKVADKLPNPSSNSDDGKNMEKAENLTSTTPSQKGQIPKKRQATESVELDKRPLKKPKAKIHRPKVVGESKPKQSLGPKTPVLAAKKSARPKPSSSKKIKQQPVTPSEETTSVLNMNILDDILGNLHRLLKDNDAIAFPKELKKIRRTRKQKFLVKIPVIAVSQEEISQRSEGKITDKRSSRTPRQNCDILSKIPDIVVSQEEISHSSKGESEKLIGILFFLCFFFFNFYSLNLFEVTLITTTSTSSEAQDHCSIVPYEQTPQNVEDAKGALVPLVQKTTRKQYLHNLFPGANEIWMNKLKLLNNISEGDEEKWKNERGIFSGRVNAFIARTTVFLGNRKFSLWKGSVIDSVVGVFLTQNVSDNLSSSAFMSLAAKYPVLDNSSHHDDHTCVKRMLEPPHKVVDKLPLNVQEVDINKLPQNVQEVDINKLPQDVKLDSEKQMLGKRKKKTEKTITEKKQKEVEKEAEKKQKEVEKEAEKKRKEVEKEAEKKRKELEWEKLRNTCLKKQSCCHGPRDSNHRDSVDWEAVKNAKASEVAEAIKVRGQHNVLAERIKDFLSRVVEIHSCIDLEWLRDAPPMKVKEYLLDFYGLGLKSVECIRLLALQHVAFPVDTNVGRIAVRLGWVPLEPLPEELQIHLLTKYPMMDSIQKYLWPRLRTLDQQTLYELHYQMITFGKVYCTKRSPNCNACPMRSDCRHYASKYASARLALPGPSKKTSSGANPSLLSLPEINGSVFRANNNEPIIEEPESPKSTEPMEVRDIEDLYRDDYSNSNYIPTIKLYSEGFSRDLQQCIDMMNTLMIQEHDMSRAVVPLRPEVASYPAPKLKDVNRLSTKHQVYELPDSHPILRGVDKRDSDDPSPYMLAILSTDETTNTSQSLEIASCSQEAGNRNRETVRGTLFIPCRTATKGAFPLNGTYFQINEVFADRETSENPIDIPRDWIWNLSRRALYCGTSTSAICRDLPTDEIAHCFWKGFVCVRAFDRKTKAPWPLAERFHMSTVQNTKGKRNNKKNWRFDEDE